VRTFNRVIRDDLAGAIAEELEPYGIETPPVRTVQAFRLNSHFPTWRAFCCPKSRRRWSTTFALRRRRSRSAIRRG
jgi:hypothetical protein